MATSFSGPRSPESTERDGNRVFRILVVEDQSSLGLMLVYNLQADGYLAEHVACADAAERHLAITPTDLIILDWMLPSKSGLEFCQQLRAEEVTRDIPIIMLSARDDERDRVRGLAMGADDYVVKPFSMQELKARVHALLRRAHRERLSRLLAAASIELDRDTHRVSRHGREIHLGSIEFRLLEHFMERPGHVFSRERLIVSIWGNGAEIDARTVDVHIGRLRKALIGKREQDPIRTVRNVGYALDETLPASKGRAAAKDAAE
jgi:two-component system, OmpR family, phosphate regulon response regulator PhoB